MYKIEFKMRSAISFVELPTFDGLLAWCYMKQKYGIVEQKLTLTESELESFDDMPLTKHPDGYFMASWMQFDESLAIESTATWKKRWANEHDHLVDFGKKTKKVRISAGEFKSYDMPITIHDIKVCWFYFDTEEIEKVKELLKYLYGIGKKTTQGYGEIESFSIEKISFNPFAEKVIRPIPVKPIDIVKNANLSVKMMGYKPPYWLPSNQGYCLV